MEVQTPADTVNIDRIGGYLKPDHDETCTEREEGITPDLCLPSESDNSNSSSSSSSRSSDTRSPASPASPALQNESRTALGAQFEGAAEPDGASFNREGEDLSEGVRALQETERCSGDVSSPRDVACDASTTDELSCSDSRRQRRSSKRKHGSDTCCPVCSITVRLPELETHFAQEVEKLATISKNLKKPRKEESSIKTTFEQVKHNRENRLTAKIARYKQRAKNEIQCPVCNLKMSGTQEDVNKHVLQCLKNGENSDTDYELIVDDDDDESFEEYEFADQTRTRAISLVHGGHRALHGETITRTTEDEDLNVDIDDTLAYGKPQYTELDVIPCATSEREDKEREQLRKAVVLDPSAQPQILESRKWSNTEEKPPDSIFSDIIAINSQSDHVVSSLKERIKDLEEQNRNAKCLICMETYTKPVVSITCWHVYCEECWLMTMGVKKLCPQCNMIVFPSDLRRIYL